MFKKPATVRNVLELLRRLINFGVNRNLCKGLAFKLTLPGVNNEKTEDLSPEQVDKLLLAIEEDPHVDAGKIMQMALYTGMRRGEIFNLKWKDINFETGFIEIRDPKGGKDQKIPMNDVARALLTNHDRTKGREYVFPGRGGGKRTCLGRVR